MNLYALLPLIGFFANMSLGIYILYIAPKEKLNRLYSLFTFALAVWSIGEFFEFTSLTPEASLQWGKFETLGSSLTPAFLLHSFLIFTKREFISRGINLIPYLYLPSLFFILISFTTNLISEGAVASWWGYSEVHGILYLPLAFYIIAYVTIGLFLCYKFYLETTSTRKKIQAKLLIVAITIPLVGGTITQVILPVLGFETMPLTTTLTTITAIIIAYTIMKFRLLTPISFSIRKKLIIGFLLPILIVGLSILLIESTFSEEAIENQVKNNLEATARNKANWINSYFSERKGDASVLASSPSVKQALDEKIRSEVGFAQDSIRRKAEDVAKQVEDYIKNHSDMTIEDLQNDSHFQEIAVQPVGKTGYTLVGDYNSMTVLFHGDPRFIDFDMYEFQEINPDLWTVVSGIQGGHDSDGFHPLEEADGTIRDKYSYISITDAKTPDGGSLFVAATTYLDEYEFTIKLLKEAEEYIQKLKEAYGYHDVLLINPSGDIWWSSHPQCPHIGINLEIELYRDRPLSKVYREAKRAGEVKISDSIVCPSSICPFSYDPILLIAAPVYTDVNETLAGVVVLQISSEQINEIMQDSTGLGETGETYLVGSDFLMRSDSRFSNESTILKRKVDTKNSRECFECHEKYGHDSGEIKEHEEKTLISKNYRGVEVLGTHTHIPEMHWCLLAEIDEKEAFAPIFGIRDTMNILFIILIILAAGFSIVLSESISKPILKLRDTANKIGEGDLDVKIDIKSGDEIGELAFAFRQMTEDMKKSRADLEGHSKNLEKEVKRRTKELDDKVRESENQRLAILNMLEDADEAQKKLQKAYKELKSLDLMKDDFVGATSHALKTPLTSITSFINLLREGKLGPVNDDQRDGLDIIESEAHRLKVLVNNILDSTKLDSGKFILEKNKTDLKALVDKAITSSSNLATARGNKITFKSPDRVYANIDASWIEKVLDNLISNAVKFTQDGIIDVRLEEADGYIKFSITDTGSGISKKYVDRIFEKFYQGEKQTTAGTGLGLYISKTVIGAHRGKIGCSSSGLDKGSTFWFTLPGSHYI